MDERKEGDIQNPVSADPQVTYEPVATSGTFNRPADYYASPAPAPGARKGCPKWIPITCGLFGCLSILLIFAAGAYLAKGGASKALDYSFGKVETELARMTGPDVPLQVRADLRTELAKFRASVRAGRIRLTDIQPVLNEMRETMADERVTAGEATTLLNALRAANSRATGGTRPRSGTTV